MQYGDEKREKLEKLEKKLYSRNAPDVIDKGRTELKNKEETEIKENWQEPKKNNFDELAAKMSGMARRKQGLVKKFFIFSILFFVVAAGVAALVFWGGVNIISSRNVDIKVVGPLSVGGGQEASFDLNIMNNNNSDLESASLFLEYATGTRSVIDLSKELNQERFVLGTIKAGESYSQNIKAVFFGEKDSVKQIKISLEYRVKNSSALFYKEKTYDISISSAPIIITSTYPKEVNSNQEISFDLEVVSNSKDKLNNFLVRIEYPFGFVFKSASPSASFGNNIWRFAELSSGEKKTILIKGNIIGQDNEERVFKINAGTASPDDERTIDTSFLQSMESVLVKKSFIGLDVSIEGEKGDYAGKGGSVIATEFILGNNLPSKLFNVSAQVSFKGGAFNATSVIPQNEGFFQSFNNTILWDKRSVAEFSEMDPGQQKNLSFRLSPLLYANVSKGVRPEIEVTITAKGERILESGSVEEVSATEVRKIVLATDIVLFAKSARSLGNIENYGPIPPKTNVPTSYTIIWSISNSFNQMSNVEVRATLPSYVKWTDLKSPSSEIFSYNQVSNEVVWSVGSILPNTGFGFSPKQIYFQLEFLPSVSQVGQTPILLGESVLSGTDKVTGLKVQSKAPAATINFSGDPTFKMGDDKVSQ